MSKHQVAVVFGSLRRESFNRRLADALVKLGPADFSFQQAPIGDLPVYNQDGDADHAESVKPVKQRVKDANGVLFVTSTSNRSRHGVLKNAIDHASRPYSQSAWAGKPKVGQSPVERYRLRSQLCGRSFAHHG